MLSLRHGPRLWQRDATSRHHPSNADILVPPGFRVVGIWGAHPSTASSTSCRMPLPSKTASCEAPASKTALKVKVASCLAALTWAWGWWWLRRGSQSPAPPWGGGTYVDSAVAQAAHHVLVTSTCLCAGQWSDPDWGTGGHTEVAQRGDPQGSHCDTALGVTTDLSTTLRRVSLPSCSSLGLLGEREQGAVGWRRHPWERDLKEHFPPAPLCPSTWQGVECCPAMSPYKEPPRPFLPGLFVVAVSVVAAQALSSAPSVSPRLTVAVDSVGAFWAVFLLGAPSPAPPPPPFSPSTPRSGWQQHYSAPVGSPSSQLCLPCTTGTTAPVKH